MRLPWPFGRAQRSPSEAGDASPGVVLAPQRRPLDAWRSLPPLAETVGPPPLVAPNRPFAAALAANEPPAPILAPLSHGRSLEAPRGIVVGVARPTMAGAGPELPRAVQRSPLHGPRRPSSGDANDSFEESPGAELAAAPPASSASSAAAPSVAPVTPAAQARPLEATIATPQRAARLLTRAPEAARPAMPVGLVGQPRAAGGARPSRIEAAAVAPLAAAAPLPAVQRSPMDASRPGPPAPVSILSAASPGDAARMTLGQMRRRGLGAPIAGGPVGANTPTFGSPLRGASAGLGTGPATATAAPGPAGPQPQRAPQPVALPASEPDVPDMPLAVWPAMTPGDGTAMPVTQGPAIQPAIPVPGPATPVVARPITQAIRSPRRPAQAASPIVSAHPLRSGVQRAPLTLPARATDDAGGGAATAVATTPTAAAGPVKIHRDSAATQLSTALDARSFTHGGEIFLPASHGSLASGTGKALLSHELTHVTQQRRFGSSLPAEHTPHGQSLEAEAVAAERAPDMPLANPPSSSGTQAASTSATEDGSRSSSGISTHVSAGPQRAPNDAVSAGGKQGTTSGASRSAGHDHSEQELEVLAHQLYHRIGRHLRRELLVDRERVGFALDLP